MKNKLSIISICFNDLVGLKKTYDSISSLLKTGVVEWTVVDGASTDGSLDYLETLEDSCLNFVSEPDAGIYDAMNKGTAMASGDWLLYLNAGDLLLNDEILGSISKFDDFDILLFDAVVYSNGKSWVRRARPFDSIFHSIPSIHQSILFKKSKISNAPYDVSMKVCGDYRLMSELYVAKLKAKVINQTLARFELGGTSTFKIAALAKEAAQVQREVLGMSVLRVFLSSLRRYISMLLTFGLFKLSR